MYVGPGVDADAHAHHAFQVTMAIRGDAAFDFGEGFVAQPITLITPDRQHAQRASGTVIASVYVDPESSHGRALAAVSNLPRVILPPLDARSTERVWTWSSGLIEMLTAQATTKPVVDPRVLRVIAHLRDNLEAGELSVEALSRVAALSPSRLTHLFSEETGVPIRPYILWVRLQRAAAALARW